MTIPEKISAAELEELTGLTDRRHRQLAAQGHFPKPRDGAYETAATIKGMFAYFRNRVSNRSHLEEAETRKRLAEAELKEMELAERKRDYLPREDVLRTWGSVCVTIKQVVRGSHLSHDEQVELLRHIREFTMAEILKGDYEEKNQTDTGSTSPPASSAKGR